LAAFTMDNKVVYNDKPTINFLNSSTGANAYLWNFGDNLTSPLKDPSHYYSVTGYRTVLLEATNEFLCSDTVSQQVLIAFDRLFPPNGFSPNAPNEIDRVFLLNSVGIAPEGYHFTVLSRWNDIVFEAKDEIKGWDGRMENGAFAPAGAYVWVLSFTDFLGRNHKQTGTVTLVY
jgi:PKD repeat protein